MTFYDVKYKYLFTLNMLEIMPFYYDENNILLLYYIEYVFAFNIFKKMPF